MGLLPIIFLRCREHHLLLSSRGGSRSGLPRAQRGGSPRNNCRQPVKALPPPTTNRPPGLTPAPFCGIVQMRRPLGVCRRGRGLSFFTSAQDMCPCGARNDNPDLPPRPRDAWAPSVPGSDVPPIHAVRRLSLRSLLRAQRGNPFAGGSPGARPQDMCPCGARNDNPDLPPRPRDAWGPSVPGSDAPPIHAVRRLSPRSLLRAQRGNPFAGGSPGARPAPSRISCPGSARYWGRTWP